MKRKQVAAVLLSAILAFPACLQTGGAVIFAAENVRSRIVEEYGEADGAAQVDRIGENGDAGSEVRCLENDAACSAVPASVKKDALLSAWFVNAGGQLSGQVTPGDGQMTPGDGEEDNKKEQNISASDISIVFTENKKIDVTGAHGRLSFVSDNTSVASVDSNGNVSAEGVGTTRITITAAETDDYEEGKTVIQVSVTAAQITASDVTIAEGTYTYDGKKKTPAVTVKYNSTKLQSGTDYAVSYSNNVDAGEASVKITAKGNYTGTVTKAFTIDKAAQKISASVKGDAKNRAAVGGTASMSVSGAQGTVTFKSSNTAVAAIGAKTGKITAGKVGTATITVTGAETKNYKKTSVAVKVKVVPGATASLKAKNTTAGIRLDWKQVKGATGYIVYRGSTVAAKFSKGTTVTFTDKKAKTNGGKYIYKVFAKAATGVSTLSKSVTTYYMSATSVNSFLNSAAGKATVKWARNAKASGYVIEYSRKADFSEKKTVSVTGAATVSKVLTGLKKGSTFYVRVCAYKTVGGKKYYSAWSASRKVTIKK